MNLVLLLLFEPVWLLLQQITHLLYRQGYTIKGAKKAIDEFAKIVASSGSEAAGAQWLQTLPPANSNDNAASDGAAPEPADTLAAGQFMAERARLEALRVDLLQMREHLAAQLTKTPLNPVADL